MKQIESFFWGIIAALGALVVQIFIFIAVSFYNNPTFGLSFSGLYKIPLFVIIAVCIEEMFKYLMIFKRVDMYSLEKSYIVNSFFVGLGFFTVELAMIAQSLPLPSIKSLAEIAIVHIGTAGIIGYLVAIKNPKKITTFLSTIFIVTLFHATYNFLIIFRTPISDYAILSILALLILINIGNLFSISHTLAQD